MTASEMVFRFDTTNSNPKHPNEEYHVYMCTDAVNEFNDLKERNGLAIKDSFCKFEYLRNGDEHYIFAAVSKICSDIFGQVLDYAKLVGLEAPMADIVPAIKRLES